MSPSQVLLLICLSAVWANESEQRHPKKRQIYREQVLPHAGGKIPDTAFETDRLFLNRLQKDGISIPDGIVPEQRSPQVYQYYNKPMRTVFHIALSSDGRYTPREGQYHYGHVPTIETTYLYPQAVGRPHILTPPNHALPVYKQFQLHNPLLNQVKFQNKKTPNFLDSSQAVAKSHAGSYKAESYQNINLLSVPLLPDIKKTNSKTYLDSYGTKHLYSEFDDFFKKFDLHQTPQAFY